MKIVRGRPEDAERLSSIARAAKGHWGYAKSWLRQWDEALTLTPIYIEAHPAYALVSNETILGFFALDMRGAEAQLDHLWVLPSAMGRGIGRRLFGFAEDVARRAGAVKMNVESDPHAEGFYLRMGATRCGVVPAPMDGVKRHLVLLEKALVSRTAHRSSPASGELRTAGNPDHTGAGLNHSGKIP